MFKVGDVKKFLSPKFGYYEIKEIIEDPDVQVSYEFDGGICPDCKKKCKIKKDYSFKRVYVLESKNGEIAFKGEMSDGELVRMPDHAFYSAGVKKVTDKIKLKSKYLKEK